MTPTQFLANSEQRLRVAITNLSARTKSAQLRYATAFAIYETACRMTGVCGNLGCDAEPGDLGFCAAHRAAAVSGSCASSRFVVKTVSCEGASDAVRMSSAHGDRPWACIRHASLLLMDDPVFWAVTPGWVPFADTEAYARAGVRRDGE